jgi:hypothetical protein
MTPVLTGVVLMALATQDTRVHDLIQSLDDDSIAMRDEAVRQLIKLGESAEEALRKELGRTSNPEVRARIGDVLQPIEREKRRRSFKGGNVVNGLCASIKADKEKDGEAIVLTVEIMNVSKEPRELVPIGSFDLRLPRESDSSSSSRAKIMVERISGKEDGSFTDRRG